MYSMSKIGNYEFPDTRFRTILKAIEVLVTTLKGKVEQEENYAKAMGQSQSGGFIQKLSDLRKYKLISKRGGIEATELAKKIVKPYTEQEKKEALNEAVRNIKLWVDLYNKIGEEQITEEQFKIHLSELAHDRDKIDKLNSAIYNSYNEIKKYLIPRNTEETEKYLSDNIDDNIVENKDKKFDKDKMLKAEIGDYYIRIPKEKEAIKKAKQILDFMANDLNESREDKKPKEKKSKE